MVRIKFTRYAKLKYDSVLDYTYNEFGATTECEFEADFLKVSKRLSNHPESSPREPLLKNIARPYRSAIIMQNWKIIYRYDERANLIIIVGFWDMRMNPKTLVRYFKKRR